MHNLGNDISTSCLYLVFFFFFFLFFFFFFFFLANFTVQDVGSTKALDKNPISNITASF